MLLPLRGDPVVYSECLPFSNIPHTSRLFLDFISSSGEAHKFYPRSPHIRQWAAAEAKQIQYEPQRRAAVANILEPQNREWGMGVKTEENLRRFRDGASVVVTGQQVGVFGGPLFAILKALTAVELAAQAEEAGVPTVPVFWLATEDHDLAEVNHTFVPTPEGALEQLGCASKGVEDAPVGDIRFGDEISPIVEKLTELLGPSDVSEAVRQAYRPGETMGTAFGKLFAAIFRDWGVI